MATRAHQAAPQNGRIRVVAVYPSKKLQSNLEFLFLDSDDLPRSALQSVAERWLWNCYNARVIHKVLSDCSVHIYVFVLLVLYTKYPRLLRQAIGALKFCRYLLEIITDLDVAGYHREIPEDPNNINLQTHRMGWTNFNAFMDVRVATGKIRHFKCRTSRHC